MNYQLIAVDMDGTLLNSENEVSERNQQALKKALDKGVKVVIATGRIFTSARGYAELLGIQTPIIACNGALIRDYLSNEVIYHNTIQQEDALKIIELCQNEQIYFHFYDQEKLYVEERWMSYLMDYYWGGRKREQDEVQFEAIENAYTYLKMNPVEVLKFVLVDHRLEVLEAIKPLLQKIDTIDIDKSWFNNLEVMNKGVSKGKALEKLGEIFNIPKEKIIAFGDNYNDLSMKEHSGAFIAMGNSDEAVKTQAKAVTTSNDEDGVALGIEKYVFK